MDNKYNTRWRRRTTDITGEQTTKILLLISTRDEFLNLPKHQKLKPQQQDYLQYIADLSLIDRIVKCLKQ